MENEIKHALHSEWFRHIALILVGLSGVFVATFAYMNMASSPLPTTLTVELSQTEGHVELGRNGTWQSASSGVEIEESDQVRVVGEGKATLSMKDGSEVRLGDNTHVALMSLSIRDFRVLNETGKTYARIIPSPARSVTIQTENAAYEALGTAFLVTNTESRDGVEVYQSTVDVRLNSEDFVRVGEGKYYFVRHDEISSAGEIGILNVESAQKDDFLVWNAQLDKEAAEKIRNLGLMEEIN